MSFKIKKHGLYCGGTIIKDGKTPPEVIPKDEICDKHYKDDFEGRYKKSCMSCWWLMRIERAKMKYCETCNHSKYKLVDDEPKLTCLQDLAITDKFNTCEDYSGKYDQKR